MEKPHAGLDECLRILLSCFRARNSVPDPDDLRRRGDHDALLQPGRLPAERGVDDVVGVGRVLGQVRPRQEGQKSGVQAH